MSVPEDSEGGTDDTVYAAPDFCTVHNGSSTIIDPSQGPGDIFGPGYIPEQTAPGSPYLPTVPSPFTTSPYSAAPGTTAPYTASIQTTAPDTTARGSEPPTTVSAFSQPSSDESSAPSIVPTVPERWHDWKYWDSWWDW